MSNDSPENGGGWPRAKEASHTTKDNARSNNLSRGDGQENREARRGWANCFPMAKSQDWMSDFTGVVTLENGEKYWVNLYKKLDRNRERYVSVNLRPWKARGS